MSLVCVDRLRLVLLATHDRKTSRWCIMTHDELVARAMRWLRNSKRHVVVLSEINSDGRECPDVIGWTRRGQCTLIECKISRTDFLRDAKKSFRREGGDGMASHRWYATPPFLVKLAELPASWGLIEIGPKMVRTIRHPIPFTPLERNIRGETMCLISAVERVTDGWGRKVFGEISPMHGQLDPHPSVGARMKELVRDWQSEHAKRMRRDERIVELEARIAKLINIGL